MGTDAARLHGKNIVPEQELGALRLGSSIVRSRAVDLYILDLLVYVQGLWSLKCLRVRLSSGGDGTKFRCRVLLHGGADRSDLSNALLIAQVRRDVAVVMAREDLLRRETLEALQAVVGLVPRQVDQLVVLHHVDEVGVRQADPVCELLVVADRGLLAMVGLVSDSLHADEVQQAIL